MILHRGRPVVACAALLLAATASAGTASGTTLSSSGSTRSTGVAAPVTAEITNARFGVHPGFTRVVLDVKGPLPSAVVTRVNKLFYDASGRPVPLQGKFFLRIRLAPASAHNEQGQSVYHGPRLIVLRLPHVRGFALTGDFEGVTSFGIAVTDRGPFHTFTLTQPNRIVIDVR